MKKLNYTITTLEPIIITRNSDDPNMYETLQYIRGTVIQGVFAQYYLRANNNIANDDFMRLIVRGDCIFANAYPFYDNKLFITAPFSMVREKYQPEVVHNLLLDATDEQSKGISSMVSVNSNQVHSLTIPKEIRLHNEINDEKRTTKEGILFNYQSLPAGMVFNGHIFMNSENDADTEVVQSLIDDGQEIRMGRSATSEYGKIRFNWLPVDSDQETKATGQVIMSLLSDTIIFNEFGFSSLNYKDINQYIKGVTIEEKPETEVGKLPNMISRKARIEGFLNVWKLRKPSENVFAAGSSFLLDKLPGNADDLINKGLGERTQEGCGQVSFTFQSTTDIDLIYPEPIRFGEKTTAPPSLPSLAHDVLESISFERAKSEIIGKALSDADKTERIPKNHLLGKLKDMAGDVNSFADNIGLLKEIAQNQLRKSHVGNQTLLDHLKYRATHIDKICELTKQVDNFIVDLTSYRTELTRLYLEQYLKQLRRKN